MDKEIVDDPNELLIEGLVNVKVEVSEFGVCIELVADELFLIPVATEGMTGKRPD